jgi:hypothetical protein
MHVLEEFKLRSPTPVAPLSLTVVSLWVKTVDVTQNELFACRVTWRSPDDGELAAPDETEVFIAEGIKRIRTFHDFRGLPIQGEGTYAFLVEAKAPDETDWGLKARVPIDVTFERHE